MATVTFDVSQLNALANHLPAAGKKLKQAAGPAVRRHATEAMNEAASIAREYPSPIDKLADSLELTVSTRSARIHTDAREGTFLEFGSPNTGAPRPWLTGPAQRAGDALYDELIKLAAEPEL